MSHLVLYGKPDCPLCDEMKDVIEQVRREIPFTVEIVDVEGGAALAAAYGHDVPVLFVDGRKAFKHRVDATALRRRLAR